MIVHLKKLKSSAIFSVRLSGVEAYLWQQPSLSSGWQLFKRS